MNAYHVLAKNILIEDATGRIIRAEQRHYFVMTHSATQAISHVEDREHLDGLSVDRESTSKTVFSINEAENYTPATMKPGEAIFLL